MTDPIADMLTRIRNAYLAKHKQVEIPHSGLKNRLALKLQELGFVENIQVEDHPKVKNAKIIKLGLIYKHKLALLNSVKRISTPGRRIYIGSNKIRKPLSGYGHTILSTSKGLMTGTEARKAKLGGEIICEIW